MTSNQRVLSIFDILGPIMIGPSSNHTAGAVRIGKIARMILGEEPTKINLYFYGSLAETYRGHMTDAAVVAGLLGMEVDDQKIKESVQRQLVSDVPLGAFLSGGVDSSLIVASMGKARTFSIGFDDPTYNELKWARMVAEHLGVDHIDDIIKPDIVGLFERLIYFLDDPIGDFSIFPTYLVSNRG